MHLILRALDRLPTWWLRAAHDIGLAAWFGGAYMGAVALNGASMEVDDPTQRGRVANAGWFRWAAIVPVAVGLHVAGGVGLTRRQARRSPRTVQAVAGGRLAILGAAAIATVASGVAGRRVTAAGDVPVATAVRPISDTPEQVAAAQRQLRAIQWIIPAATGTLLLLDAWQQDHGGTCLLPPRLGGSDSRTTHHRWWPPTPRR